MSAVGDMAEPGARVFLRTTRTTPPSAPARERFAATVFNTGNYFFEQALLRHLRDVQVVDCLEAVPESVDCLVLSMSNFISPAAELGDVAAALEARRIRQIVMVGAGAQAYEYGDDIALTPGTRRFLDLVADRSVAIGVRGHYTAELLHGMGIRNVEVIGCPSAFWHGSADFALRKPVLPHAPRLAINATPLGHFRDRVSALLGHGMRHAARYVIQSEQWLMPLLEAAGATTPEVENGLSYYAHPACSPLALRAWLAGHLAIFFDIAEWIEAMRDYDFVYGSRFHGNMAAVQAGVPALNLTFDTRTRELCEYLNLPFMQLQDFSGEMTPAELYERADYSLFNATYAQKLGRYAGFLERNGVAHALPAPAASPGDRPACSGVAQARRVQAAAAAELLDGALAAGFSEDRLLREVQLRLQPSRDRRTREAVEMGVFESAG